MAFCVSLLRRFSLAALLGCLSLGPTLAAGSAPALASSTSNPMIHQQGTAIVDGSGNPFRPRGVNLGGWLNWEGYIFGAGVQVTQSGLQSQLTSLAGASAASAFTQAVDSGFITDADMARIAQLGFNTVRLPINYRLLEDDAQPFVYKASGWATLDHAISLAEAHNLYVVLDLHAAPGGQSTMPDADPEPTALWASSSNQARTVALWQAIAARYAAHTNILGYDLLNEPNPPQASQLTTLDQQIVAAIRQVDSQHMVILEGAGLGGNFSAFTSVLDSNELYSFHLYATCATCPDTRTGVLNAIHYAANHMNVPLYVGEFGENTLAWDQSTEQLLESPSSGVAGWTFWTWKRAPVSNGNPNLVVLPAPSTWKYLMAWVTMPHLPLPTATSTQTAMNAFLQAMAFQPAAENPQLEAALHAGW